MGFKTEETHAQDSGDWYDKIHEAGGVKKYVEQAERRKARPAHLKFQSWIGNDGTTFEVEQLENTLDFLYKAVPPYGVYVKESKIFYFRLEVLPHQFTTPEQVHKHVLSYKSWFEEAYYTAREGRNMPPVYRVDA